MEAPKIKVALKPDNIQEAKKAAVKALRPNWKVDEAFCTDPVVGYRNTVVIVYKNANKDAQDAFVMKNSREEFAGNIDDFHRLCVFLSQHNIGPKVLGLLDNGVCMAYIEGETFGYESPRCFDEDFQKRTAEEIARIHSKKVLKDAKKSNIRKANVTGCDFEKYWDQIFSKDPFAKFKKDYPSKDDLLKTIKQIEQEMLQKGDLEEALVHMDFSCSNVFFTNKNQNGIVVFDFDFSGINYIQNDLAWFFRIFKEVTEPQSDQIPGKDYEIKFLKYYLKCRKALDGEPEAKDADAEKLYKQIQKAKVLVTLRTIVVSTFILHYSSMNQMPEVVDHMSGGVWGFVQKAISMWKNFPEYKQKVFKQYE